ncbi:MAG: hypothetical protein VB934_06235, partial [Polyangiaceae bacterium]
MPFRSDLAAAKARIASLQKELNEVRNATAASSQDEAEQIVALEAELQDLRTANRKQWLQRLKPRGRTLRIALAVLGVFVLARKACDEGSNLGCITVAWVCLKSAAYLAPTPTTSHKRHYV